MVAVEDTDRRVYYSLDYYSEEGINHKQIYV